MGLFNNKEKRIYKEVRTIIKNLKEDGKLTITKRMKDIEEDLRNKDTYKYHNLDDTTKDTILYILSGYAEGIKKESPYKKLYMKLTEKNVDEKEMHGRYASWKLRLEAIDRYLEILKKNNKKIYNEASAYTHDILQHYLNYVRKTATEDKIREYMQNLRYTNSNKEKKVQSNKINKIIKKAFTTLAALGTVGTLLLYPCGCGNNNNNSKVQYSQPSSTIEVIKELEQKYRNKMNIKKKGKKYIIWVKSEAEKGLEWKRGKKGIEYFPNKKAKRIARNVKEFLYNKYKINMKDEIIDTNKYAGYALEGKLLNTPTTIYFASIRKNNSQRNEIQKQKLKKEFNQPDHKNIKGAQIKKPKSITNNTSNTQIKNINNIIEGYLKTGKTPIDWDNHRRTYAPSEAFENYIENKFGKNTTILVKEVKEAKENNKEYDIEEITIKDKKGKIIDKFEYKLPHIGKESILLK